MQLAVLASGTGSILLAMLEQGLDVAVVLVDRPCRAVDLAREHDVTPVVVERTDFGSGFDRLAYSTRVVDALEDHGVDVIAMAGFGTVLAEPFFERYAGRVLNTHPALLPSFPGWNGVRDALD
ncbi:MAG: formyltransferase family protein, partial [Actinomycetota bacterium]|nr:formyltransferase family protein [Actinomycetota bacterium]